MGKKIILTGHIFACEYKDFDYDTEIMLPSKKINEGMECSCIDKIHKKTIKVKVTFEKLDK